MRGNGHRLFIPWHVSLRLLHCSIALTLSLSSTYVNRTVVRIAARHHVLTVRTLPTSRFPVPYAKFPKTGKWAEGELVLSTLFNATLLFFDRQEIVIYEESERSLFHSSDSASL